MVDATTQGLTPLAKLVMVLGAGMLILGVVWHGATLEDTKRLWRDLFERPSGTMA
jgi:hypothetical protein